MSALSPGARAVAALELEDVFVIGGEYKVSREHNPSAQFTEISFQHRVQLDTQILSQTRSTSGPEPVHAYFVRYFVLGECRLLRQPLAEGVTDPSPEDILAEMTHTLAADYLAPKDFANDRDALSAFGKNVLLHVIPFWREAVAETSARMRLPRFVIPMKKPAGANG